MKHGRDLDDIKAGVWPGVDDDGQCVDVDGSTFTLTWEKIQEKMMEVFLPFILFSSQKKIQDQDVEV